MREKLKRTEERGVSLIEMIIAIGILSVGDELHKSIILKY